MAGRKFSVTAQLALLGPTTGNITKVVADINKALKGVLADVNVKVNDAKLTAAVTKINKRLQAVRDVNLTTKVNSSSLTTSVNQINKAISSINTKVNPQINSAPFNTLAKQAKAAQRQVKSTISDIERFGQEAAKSIRKYGAFTVATGAFFKLSQAINGGIEDAIKFDRELVRVAQVTGNSMENLKGLSNEVTRLSTAFGISSEAILESAVTLSQAGLSAKDTKVALEALAKTGLSASFGDIRKTTEASIAAMQQFGYEAKDLEQVLGSINAVAAAFAVESDDIAVAIRRAGGAFEAAGGNLDEFQALFTSVRQTTRESAESIATGFRTIFARLQRVRTQNFLKNLGIDVLDKKGLFIGPFEAIRKLSEALKDLSGNDPRFAQITEELGGFRQISKVIPLIEKFDVAQKALNISMRSQDSLTRDAAVAQQSMAVQIGKVREEFLALVRVIADSSGFRKLLNITLELSRAFIRIADTIQPLIGPMLLIGGLKLSGGIKEFGRGFFSKITGFNTGGVVPGKGNGDTVPAMLTPGEFVINKKSAQAIGYGQLGKINKYAKGGKVHRYANGGSVDSPQYFKDLLAGKFDNTWTSVAGTNNPKPKKINISYTPSVTEFKPTQLASRKRMNTGSRINNIIDHDSQINNEEFKALVENQTKSEKYQDSLRAIQFYQGGSSEINRYIGGRNEFTETLYKKRAKELHKATREFKFDRDLVTYSGLDSTSNDVVGELINAGNAIGKTFTLGRFLSTSADYQQSTQFGANGKKTGFRGILRVRNYKGQPGIAVSTGSALDNEKEIILPNRSNFRIVDYLNGGVHNNDYGLDDRHTLIDVERFAQGGKVLKVTPKRTKGATTKNIGLRNKTITGTNTATPIYDFGVAALNNTNTGTFSTTLNAGNVKGDFPASKVNIHVASIRDDIRQQLQGVFYKNITNALEQGASVVSKTIGASPRSVSAGLLRQIGGDAVVGSLFEGSLSLAGAPYDDNRKQSATIDFPSGMGAVSSAFNNAILSSIPTEAKGTFDKRQSGNVIAKIIKYVRENPSGLSQRANAPASTPATLSGNPFAAFMSSASGTQISPSQLGGGFKALDAIRKSNPELASMFDVRRLGGNTVFIKRNSGGGVPGQGNSDTVPALLTPGEFVINKQSAQAIGMSKLHQLNKVGKYNKGGRVKRYNTGGAVNIFDRSAKQNSGSFDILQQAGGIGLALAGFSTLLGTAGEEVSKFTGLIAQVAGQFAITNTVFREGNTVIDKQLKKYGLAPGLTDKQRAGVKSLGQSVRQEQANKTVEEARKRATDATKEKYNQIKASGGTVNFKTLFAERDKMFTDDLMSKTSNENIQVAKDKAYEFARNKRRTTYASGNLNKNSLAQIKKEQQDVFRQELALNSNSTNSEVSRIEQLKTDTFLGQNKKKRLKFGRNVAIGGAIASVAGSFGGQFINDNANSAIKEGRDTTSFGLSSKTQAGVGGALSSASNFGGLGASIGALGGPVGAAIGGVTGALIGGITGFISSSKEAEKQLRAVKLDKAIEKFSRSLNAFSSDKLNVREFSGDAFKFINDSFKGGVGNDQDTRAAFKNVGSGIESFFEAIAKDSTTMEEFNARVGDSLVNFSYLTEIPFQDLQDQYKKQIKSQKEAKEAQDRLINSYKDQNSVARILTAFNKALVESTIKFSRLDDSIDALSSVVNFTAPQFKALDISSNPEAAGANLLRPFGEEGAKVSSFASQSKLVKEALPDILRSIQISPLTGEDTSAEDAIASALEKKFPGIAKEIVSSVVGGTSSVIGAEAKPARLFEKFNQDEKGTVDEITKNLNFAGETIAKFAELTAQQNQRLAGLYEISYQIQTKVNDLEQEKLKLAINTGTLLDNNSDKANIGRGRNRDIATLQGIAGRGSVDTKDLTQRAITARDAIRETQNKISFGQSQGQDINPLLAAQTKNRIELERTTKALRAVADGGFELAAAQEALTQAQDERKFNRNTLDTQVFGSRKDKESLTRTLAAVRGLSSGKLSINNLNDEAKSNVSAFLKENANVKFGDKTGEQIERKIAIDERTRQLAEAGVTNPKDAAEKQVSEAFDRAKAEKDAFSNLVTVTQRQSDALTGLQKILDNDPLKTGELQKVQQVFLTQLQQVLIDSLIAGEEAKLTQATTTIAKAEAAKGLPSKENLAGAFDAQTRAKREIEAGNAVFASSGEAANKLSRLKPADITDEKLRQIATQGGVSTQEIDKIINGYNEKADSTLFGGDRLREASKGLKQNELIELLNQRRQQAMIDVNTAKDTQANELRTRGINPTTSMEEVEKNLRIREAAPSDTQLRIEKQNAANASARIDALKEKRNGTGGTASTGGNSSSNMVSSFDNAINKFKEITGNFAGTMQTLADMEMNINAKHTVEVIVNGADVLSKLEPKIQEMVVGQTMASVNKMIEQKFPDVGRMYS